MCVTETECGDSGRAVVGYRGL